MDDFESIEEMVAFRNLSEMPPWAEVPFVCYDSYCHGLSLLDIGVCSGDYADIMERFVKTFSPVN